MIRFSSGTVAFPGGHALLHLDGAPDRIDGTRKLQEQPVAHRLDRATAVFGDLGIDQIAQMGFQTRQRAVLVEPHQARVADHVGRDNGGQSSLSRHDALRLVTSQPTIGGAWTADNPHQAAKVREPTFRLGRFRPASSLR
jgi:hypothetical protein